YTPFDLAVIWAVLTTGFHGIAGLIAGYLREKRVKEETWTNRPLQKAWVSVIGACGGYVFLMVYLAMMQEVSLIDLIRYLVWVPLPFVTAYCVVEFFGSKAGESSIRNNLRSLLDSVIQAGVTALLAFFACQAWREIDPPMHQVSEDFFH